MKIGVTSQNFRTITGHAGKARRFLIYELDAEDHVHQVDQFDLPKTMSIHAAAHDQSHPLDELDVLLTGGCGAGFIRKMQARYVDVIVTDASDPVLAVRDFAQGTLLPVEESVQLTGHGPGAGCHHTPAVRGKDGGCGCHQH